MFALCVLQTKAWLVIPGVALVDLGANVAPFTQLGGELPLLCTSIFLHAGLVHLAFNMVALAQVGPLVEQLLGSARFCVLYLCSGLVASAVSMLASTTGLLEAGVAVGASGAICGLIGGVAVLGYRIQGRQSPLARGMLRWLLITLAFGYVITLTGRASIDNYAHVGGAVFGAVLALLFRRGVTYSPLGRALRIGACALIVAGSFAWQFGVERQARTLSKVAYLTGQCGELRTVLRHRGKTDAQVAALGLRCEQQLRER